MTLDTHPQRCTVGDRQSAVIQVVRQYRLRMICILQVDAFVVLRTVVVLGVGTPKYYVASVRGRLDEVEHRGKRHPLPLSDRTPALHAVMRAELQFNIQPDVAGDYEPWLIDAFVRKEWGDQADGWGLQSGIMA